MTKELAKTLATALVQFIDRERPEGTMCCSNSECESIEKAFEGVTYDVVEAIIKKKLEAPLTPFQQCLNNVLRRVYFAEVPGKNVTSFIVNEVRHCTDDLLALAKKELCNGCNANLEGYIKGQQDAKKQYNESVAYHYPEPVPPGVAYKSPQCYTDVMVTPNTTSGTSTAKEEG